MQLKRDTDYALRILFHLKETIPGGDDKHPRSLTLSELASRAGIPRATARRICECLAEHGLLRSTPDLGRTERAYSADPAVLERTLLEVIEATEGTGELFAVFDRSSLMYRSCERALDRIGRKHTRALASASLGALFAGKERSPETFPTGPKKGPIH